MDLLPQGSGPSDTSTNNTPTMLTPATTRRSLSPIVPPEKQWGNGIDLETSSSDDLNDYIRWRIDTYEGRKWRNDTLSEIFALDFEHLEQETFDACRRDLIQDLREILRQRGVYVRKGRGVKVAKELAAVVQAEIPWPEDDPERPGVITKPGPTAVPLQSLPTDPSGPSQSCSRGHSRLESKRFLWSCGLARAWDIRP